MADPKRRGVLEIVVVDVDRGLVPDAEIRIAGARPHRIELRRLLDRRRLIEP